ncbi:MAG: PPC domain-containing protein [Cyanobacteria bacterium P01_A01_bin.114]
MQLSKLALAGALSLGYLVALSTISAAQSTTLLSEQGQLEVNDNRLDDDSLYDLYRFTGDPDQQVTITLASSEFDTYLFLVDPNGDKLAENDDIEGSTNSSLTVNLPTAGEYMIVANSYNPFGRGAYTLTVTAMPVEREPAPDASPETTVETASETISETPPETNPEPTQTASAESDTVDPALLLGEWSASGECDRTRYAFTPDGDYLWLQNLDGSWETAYKGVYGTLSPAKIDELGITSSGAIYVADQPNAGGYTIEILALDDRRYEGFWNVQLSEGLSFENPDDAYFSYERCPARY